MEVDGMTVLVRTIGADPEQAGGWRSGSVLGWGARFWAT